MGPYTCVKEWEKTDATAKLASNTAADTNAVDGRYNAADTNVLDKTVFDRNAYDTNIDINLCF